MIIIKIQMDKETGRFEVNIPEDIPIFTAVGALEAAKNLILTGDLTPTDEPEIKQINEDLQ